MIRQLMRCDPAWKLALSLAPVGVIGGLLLADRQAAAITLPIIVAIAMIVRPYERATLFTAALPVPARQIFLARLCAVMATWWLPALTAMITAVALGRPIGIAVTVGELGFTVTACAMIPFSLRPAEFTAPWRPLLLWAVVTCVAVIPLTSRSPEILAGVSVVAAGLLLARTWRAIPGSFQAAPVEAVRASARRDRGGQPAWAWWPVARALFAPAVFWLPMILLMGNSRQWMVGALFGCFPVGMALGRSHWVLTLPVHRGRVLAGILACCGLPVMVGYCLRLVMRNAPPFSSAFVLRGAVVLAVFLTMANAILIVNHHRMRGMPKAVQVAFTCVAAVGPVLLSMEGLIGNNFSVTVAVDRLLLGVSAAIPNPWIAAAVAVPPAVALWWAATRLFNGAEILQTRYASVWDGLGQGSGS